MPDINQIQNKILSLSPPKFQKFCDSYLYKKFEWTNIHTLGTKEGSDKTTIGVPDTFSRHADGTYTFAMYGTVRETDIPKKLKGDIEDCINPEKTKISVSEIKEIICCHVSTNISPALEKDLQILAGETTLTLIGLDVMSMDMSLPRFRFIAKDYLDIPLGTNQIYTVKGFIEAYDKNTTVAPLAVDFRFRSDIVKKIEDALNTSTVALVTGAPGIGKTKVSLEICNNFIDKEYNVLCVKSKGLGLYDDLSLMISEPGSYLIFMDDVNDIYDLRSVVALLIETKCPDVRIKVLATVRDYAKSKVSTLISELGSVSEISVPILTDTEIKLILVENFKVYNTFIQERIVGIAKGNIRLAVFASKLLEQDINYINDAVGIFKNYYGPIFAHESISVAAQKVLFIVALLQPLNVENDILLKKILHDFEISNSDFSNIISNLHDQELVDQYEYRIIRIEDQSFKDFLIYNALIEHKYIHIDQLLAIGFNLQPVKILSAIKTILRLFGSEENFKYVSDQVNKRWDAIPPEEEDNYLNSFFGLNPTKTLDILQKRIPSKVTSDFQISYDFFEKEKNNQYINSQEMQILSGFKKSDVLDQAIFLSIKLLYKNPNYFMDIYFVFTKEFLYDESSSFEHYEYQIKLFDTLVALRNNSNYNLDFLLIKVAEKLLQINFSGIKPTSKNTTVISYSFNLQLTDELEYLRNKIWLFLSEVYADSMLQKEVLRIFVSNIWSGDTQLISPIINFDIKCIMENFIKKWNKPSDIEIFVLNHFMNKVANLKLDINTVEYKNIYDNLPMNSYFTILQKYYFNGDFDSQQECLKSKISSLVTNFALHDFKILFEIAHNIEHDRDISPRSCNVIGNNLKLAIENCNVPLILDVLNAYFESQAPFSDICVNLIDTIYKKYDFKTIYDILDGNNYPKKNIWLLRIFSNIHADEINLETSILLRNFVASQTEMENPRVPFLSTVKLFSVLDSSIISFVTDQVCLLSSRNAQIANNYVFPYFSNPIQLMEIFKDSIGQLQNLYRIIHGQNNFDYEFGLLLALINYDFQYWNVYTKEIANYQEKPENLFLHIWDEENYKDYIDVAFENLIMAHENASIGYEIYQELFPKNVKPKIRNRIKKWIASYIEMNIKDKNRIHKIFFYYISNDNADNKLFFIDVFLQHNKNFSDFQTLPLLPTYQFFSGSEIPLIDAQIGFLELLLNSDSLKYKFENKHFIMKKIQEIQKHRLDAKFSEYQEERLL